MNEKKHIRVIVTTIVELETNLSVDGMIQEFVENGNVIFNDTANVKVIGTEWRETNKISYIQYSKDGNSSILKPIKNPNDEIRY